MHEYTSISAKTLQRQERGAFATQSAKTAPN
jgi:hypothetical protein